MDRSGFFELLKPFTVTLALIAGAAVFVLGVVDGQSYTAAGTLGMIVAFIVWALLATVVFILDRLWSVAERVWGYTSEEKVGERVWGYLSDEKVRKYLTRGIESVVAGLIVLAIERMIF
jgi:hypothetical protein